MRKKSSYERGSSPFYSRGHSVDKREESRYPNVFGGPRDPLVTRRKFLLLQAVSLYFGTIGTSARVGLRVSEAEEKEDRVKLLDDRLDTLLRLILLQRLSPLILSRASVTTQTDLRS